MIINHAFPWGNYIGDLTYQRETIPLCLDNTDGGFCLLYDQNSELNANNFIENIALNIIEAVPIGNVIIDILDTTHKKRFRHLSCLQSEKLYNIAYNQTMIIDKFNKLEALSLDRHHNILSLDTETISDYNQKNEQKEAYHLLLINLDCFIDNTISHKRIKNFLDSAYDIGFYIIFFGSDELLDNDSNELESILRKFSQIKIENKTTVLTKDFFEFIDKIPTHSFKQISKDKDQTIANLLKKLELEKEESNEQDFLSIPIGTTKNGKDSISFDMGDKSSNYHAFITGVTGSGKTTLLNHIILGIAEKYTSEELQLYLMDYKDGVEFQVFKDHPNCQKIFLDNSDVDASIGLLQQFSDILTTRSKTFKEKEVSSIMDYNELDGIKKMPRIILVIDEVHKLFVGNYNYVNQFSTILKALMRQGRSYGLHIILSTQSLAGTQIDRELMGQIMLRISYKVTNPTDSESIFTYGNTDALHLNKYELIYNDNAGSKKNNILCKVNPPVDIKRRIHNILYTRAQSLILKPTIVSTEKPDSIQPINFRKEQQSQVNISNKRGFNTQREQAALKLLEKQGIKVSNL
ncbi:MAG: Cell division protein FtsK [uncultured Sulfurovum sp.]|uniref:Cell division protein FtsK n=1 Tax=uncultured Sulfurovum sp. TaxID=269237 RepID=A0A6S6TCV6_9BACT|nr:MAG: Cell division protein FtsK [uncultured Sulfurovum sp.]